MAKCFARITFISSLPVESLLEWCTMHSKDLRNRRDLCRTETLPVELVRAEQCRILRVALMLERTQVPSLR